MENNNLEQGNNNVENNISVDTPVVQNTVVSTPNQGYNQYQSSGQNGEANLGKVTNSPKKNGPLIIFGIVLLVSIVLVVTLFMENKNGFSDNKTKLINSNTKTLVVYFSHDGENYGRNLDLENKKYLDEGNTEIMAKKIANFIGATLYEIEPVEPYPDDLTKLYGATKIELNKNVYPEIKTKVTNLDSYDVIVIGYPIWHATYPQIIKTFVRDNESVLKNKVIVPFNTHAGSGSAGTYKKLFNLIGIPDDKGLNGLAINGADVKTSDDAIKSWLNGIGYDIK